MSTFNIQLLCRRSIDFPELAIFASPLGAMINLQWLELPMTRTNFPWSQRCPSHLSSTVISKGVSFKVCVWGGGGRGRGGLRKDRKKKQTRVCILASG